MGIISPSHSGSTDGINSRIVEGQTHDSLKLSPDAHSTIEKQVSELPTLSTALDCGAAPSTLRVGSTFRFRLTVLQASHVPSDYADIFCQFK